MTTIRTDKETFILHTDHVEIWAQNPWLGWSFARIPHRTLSLIFEHEGDWVYLNDGQERSRVRYEQDIDEWVIDRDELRAAPGWHRLARVYLSTDGYRTLYQACHGL